MLCSGIRVGDRVHDLCFSGRYEGTYLLKYRHKVAHASRDIVDLLLEICNSAVLCVQLGKEICVDMLLRVFF